MIPKLDVYKKCWSIESDDVIKPGLDQIQKVLDKIDHPEKKIKVIHVAGTNGKGSTIAFMASVLKEHGYRVGVFSSPALIDIHDQIQLDGLPISEEELDKTFKEMKRDGISGMLTNFELLTVAAFVTFNRFQPDYVLVETGMGGKLDSTNVVTPVVSVITSIALDHTALLGHSLREIAFHKAGIIKKERPVVVGELDQEALDVVQEIARKKESPLFFYSDEAFYKTGKMTAWQMTMKGCHQIRNAAVAITALRVAHIPLTNEKIEVGIRSSKLSNRFEEISPDVFLDGAHNPAAAKELAKTIKLTFPGEKVDFVIGMLKGKDIQGTLDELIEVAQSFTFLTFDHPEAASANELMHQCNFDKKKIVKALNTNEIISEISTRKKVITGSLYLLASLFKKVGR